MCSSDLIFKIILPLSKSVTMIIAIFTFMAMWDEFLWYLIVTKDYNLMPLSVLLGLYTRGEYSSYPGILTAGATRSEERRVGEGGRSRGSREP